MSNLIQRFQSTLRQGRRLYSSNARSVFAGARGAFLKARQVDAFLRGNDAFQQIVQAPIYNEILGGVGFLEAKLPDLERGLKELDRLAEEADKLAEVVSPIVRMQENMASQAPATPSPPSTPVSGIPAAKPPSKAELISIIGKDRMPKVNPNRGQAPSKAPSKAQPPASKGIIASLQEAQAAKDAVYQDIFQRVVPQSIPFIQGFKSFAPAFGLK